MLNAKIEKLSHDGRGIAYIEGKITFIKNALPGEEVAFERTKRHRQYDEGKTLEILNPSPLRVTPRCTVFGVCGGCALQHLDPVTQLDFKQHSLAEKLSQAQIEPQAWLPPLQAKVWGYRHKARLGVRFVRKKNEVLVGFREADSNFLTNMNRCEVLHPTAGEQLEKIKALLTTLSIREEIPQIEVAIDETHTALIFRHLVPMPDADRAKLKTLHDTLGYVILLQPKGLDSIHQIFPEEKATLQYTSLPATDSEPSIRIPFEPTDFVQVNFSLNPLMVKQALDLLAPTATDTVLDLFSGLGNFSFPLARRAGRVIAVEGDARMTARGKLNAEREGLSHLEFHTADLFDLTPPGAFYIKADKMLLDPPRAGAEALCRNIERFAPDRIVYVSCDPATLVRDLEILVKEKGYVLQKIGVMDMFPHTAHVESMALLSL